MPGRPPPPAGAPRTAVVGGGLAGMAAAARLAKMGHAVTLYEARETLGGTWAPYPLPGSDVLVDDAPGVLGFPAPWRDLFRKSGRPLEAELARSGYALVPAAPAAYAFADGSTLVLPADRGEQHDALTRAYGPGPARRWRDLLDGLDDVWQTLRPLGIETERPAGRLPRETRRRLWAPRTVADLADRLDHPSLRALVRSAAYRQGSSPERTPALAAVDLALTRTFGRWRVEPAPGADTGDTGRSSVLAQALAERLRLRRVDVEPATPVTAVHPAGAGWSVQATDTSTDVDTVVLAIDPGTAAALCPAAGRGVRGRLPAGAPHVSHVVDPAPTDARVETVTLDPDGVPVVTYRRRSRAHEVVSTHDYRTPTPRPAYGLAARRFRGWARLPGTRTDAAGVVLAGPSSPAGPGPSQVVLSGALAAYAVAGRRD